MYDGNYIYIILNVVVTQCLNLDCYNCTLITKTKNWVVYLKKCESD